ncbi:type I phosphomannose isomerase catalytic subunit [Marinoscillum furvescens]|uniref:Phosphohexomutase n=1 Tax=Marinoscillum furvescens DSM 4134 TaxID=1122208 RepID=A0A3D9L8I4_MARFU|nr:type I phosphomannose isomerase catalytic subunit [Marinoscillum furvescens]REE01596.1 mannose-6-phosphate isomerase type 1 [Marinoscillum furvescens DSM 4134]
MGLYPLKFKTIFKDKIWGGQKIKSILGKDFSPLPNCGETWELSGVKGNISEVTNGELAGKLLTDVIAASPKELLGERIHSTYGEEFPLLIKFIDAADDLSIQVHPDDELAQKRHNSFGKTEMWYIMQADEGATLISGFNQDLDKESYKKYFDEGKLNDILNREEANAGDVFFLPAGRVHTIGKGLLLAEIQQTSDVTYRIYDFDRTDAEGNKRELHLEESLDAIDYKKYDQYKTPYLDKQDERVGIVSCQYFSTNKLHLTENFAVDHSGLDCFKIYICLDGKATVAFDGGKESLAMGDVVLVPASIEKYQIETSGGVTLLESYIGK